MAQPGWMVETYQTPRGERPLRAFLDSLTGDQAAQAAALIQLLGALGSKLRRPPHSKQVEPGLWEMRRHQVRIFYTFCPGRRIILLDGIVTKQDEMSREAFRRVRGYLMDLQLRERGLGYLTDFD